MEGILTLFRTCFHGLCKPARQHSIHGVEYISVTDPEAVINKFVSDIHPNLVSFVTNTAFSASLFTLFITLLVLSTKESRRRLVFRLNVFAICLVLMMGILLGIQFGKPIVDPFNPPTKSVITIVVIFILFPPILCDSILLTHIFALYPVSSTPPATLLKIFTIPFCIKCARVILFVDDCSRGIAIAPDRLFRNPNLIAEWTMQIVDNMYSVGLFLYNLHVRTGSIKRSGGMPACVRQIFYISAANFVLPLIFNIVLIVLFLTTARCLVVDALLWYINSYVTVMGVLCATLWFSGSEWVQTRGQPLSGDVFSLRTNLRTVHDRKSGSETGTVDKWSSTPHTADLDVGPATHCKQPATLAEEEKYCTV